jgi:glycosyltransferase involved in cell wall biosynthesis
MPKLVFLTIRMKPGYGLSEMVSQFQRHLIDLGWDVITLTSEKEIVFDAPEALSGYLTIDKVEEFILGWKPDVIVATSSPYFEMLPQLAIYGRTIAFEAGDPTPEFFSSGETLRRNIILNKELNVYPEVDKVLAISFFLQNEINWPESEVIHLGCDHISDFGVKENVITGRKFRVGTLARIGKGENDYKGVELFVELARMNTNMQFEVMGFGTKKDAMIFQSAGLITHLNASDAEREFFLRNIDVFISSSKWEGFNLPLVEAQALGTAAVAFDLGAHPEVTPYLMSSISEANIVLRHWQENDEALSLASARSYNFVRSKFNWFLATQELDRVARELLANKGIASYHKTKSFNAVKRDSAIKRGYHALKIHGLRYFVSRVIHELGRRSPYN